MKQERRTRFGDERGATLVLVAISMVVILGVAALAVDLAAAFAWRAEAQKIADSASLAGASAFLDEPDTALARPVAEERAYEYALLHTIKKVPVDSSEVTVEVLPQDEKVRVYIARLGLPTWFARILGVGSIDVRAVAAAQAFAAGEARCLKPIVLPDLWDEASDDTDGDNVWDDGEEWEYGDDAGDTYQRFEGTDDPNAASATGYGSNHRTDLDGDYGRLVQLKAQNPQSQFNFEPGLFFPWRLPEDPNMEDCDRGGGGGSSAGGSLYRKNLCECNNSPIELFTDYDLEPGNMVGPTRQGVSELVNDDPDVYWEPAANGGRGGPARPGDGGWVEVGTSTPRVIKVALMDPGEITGPGMQSVQFNNFALVFLEALGNGNQAPVNVRFMYYAGGSGEGSTGSTQGSLVKFLRLVE